MAATRSLSTEIGIKPACDAFGIVRSGFYRGQGPATAPAPRPSPPRTLSSDERQAVLVTLHSDRFVDTAPATVYATLLDEGRYHCSIRTLYRILDEHAVSRPKLIVHKTPFGDVHCSPMRLSRLSGQMATSVVPSPGSAIGRRPKSPAFFFSRSR